MRAGDAGGGAARYRSEPSHPLTLTPVAGLLAHPHASVLLPRAARPLPGAPGCHGEQRNSRRRSHRQTGGRQGRRSLWIRPRVSSSHGRALDSLLPPGPCLRPLYASISSQGSGHQQMLGRMLDGGRETITVSEVDSFASRLNSVLSSDMSAVSAWVGYRRSALHTASFMHSCHERSKPLVY